MQLIERGSYKLSLSKQCELLDINRSRIYYEQKPADEQDIEIMNEIRIIYQECPFYGYRRMHAILRSKGYSHNRKKTQRLMQLTGLQALYPKKRTTVVNPHHKKYPYLLKGLAINRVNQVWQVDITYIKLRHGFGYLVCLIDIFSRRIMGWEFSPFPDKHLCLDALMGALKLARPEIINSDQGCQFTSQDWIEELINKEIKISMDGKGRWADNIYIERLWRSIKYEAVYLHSFDTMQQARDALAKYIVFYNQSRPHQALDYKTPNSVYHDSIKRCKFLRDHENQNEISYTDRGGDDSQIQPSFLS